MHYSTACAASRKGLAFSGENGIVSRLTCVFDAKGNGMSEALEKNYDRMRQVLALRRPDRLPCSDWRWIEYRKDVYHLGDPDVVPAPGEVAVSKDGRRKITRDGGVWAVDAKEKYKDHTAVLSANLDAFEVEEVGPRMLNEMARLFADGAKRAYPIPSHYATLVTRATIEFGWEPFLLASALEPRAFGRILDRFAEASLAVARGWSRTPGVEAVSIHDDIAATRGPFMSPQWYGEYVFPWYRRIFAEIHKAGKKVLYVGDGNYAPVLDGLMTAEPDGLYIETTSMNPREFMRRAGKDKFYLIKTDSRNIDFGTPEDICRELRELRELHEEFPGMMMYRGGGNPKPGNAEAFDRYYKELLVYQ